MTITSNTSQFKEERELTDESLISERVKTDESLSGSQKKAERKTDEKVKNARLESDENRAQGRLDSTLHEERLDEDSNVEKERTLMDAVIRDERNQKDFLLNVSLNKEREETDLNLSLEREQVDIEVERTKTALTTRDEFLAIVSHDLRNPIGAVVSSSTHLLEDPSVELNDELRYWVKFIKRNAESSLRLISDILDMERFAEGKLQLVKTSHNLDELITNAIESFGHLALEKNIKLSRLPYSKSLTVICDGDRISQVLSNLIGNALKFTPQDGSVSVDVKESQKGIEISISDTGPGIPDDQKTKIFSRFTQISNKDRSGLGLGLYISKMLVEAHQGSLWVTSVPGNGSTFTFLLRA